MTGLGVQCLAFLLGCGGALAAAASLRSHPRDPSCAPSNRSLSIHYLNLDRSVARRWHMEKQLSELAVDGAAFARVTAERWPATYMTDRAVRRLLPRVIAHKRHRPNFVRGMLGVRDSNMRLLRHLAELERSRRSAGVMKGWAAEAEAAGSGGVLYLVLEDDVILHPGFLDGLNCLLGRLPPAWDAIKLDCHGPCVVVATGLPFMSRGRPFYRAAHSDSHAARGAAAACHCDGVQKATGCWFCGGGYATLYNPDPASLARVLRVWDGANATSVIDDHDCQLVSRALRTYCADAGLVSFEGGGSFVSVIPKQH